MSAEAVEVSRDMTFGDAAREAPTPRAVVRAMKEYHPPLGNRDGLRLDFNENTLACSPRVREALAQVTAGALTRYPERAPSAEAYTSYME